ncbi:DUF11 domain-containing protein [Candidatus Saccharibacteria bacterium]|nr:DUF11 domain-containing protein [Candidatus Saccharibacteria bacterium]
MFKKLVSNLPFSPSLISQLGFYARRLKKEQAMRKLGLVFTVFALVIQSFAIFSPPDSANAKSTNDVLYGGCYSKQQCIQFYDENKQGFRALLDRLYITRDDLVNSSWGTFRSGDFAYSFGRETKYARNGHVVTADGTTFYHGNPPSPNYVSQGLIGNFKYGKFAIMAECGNPFVNIVPPKPCPWNPALPEDDPACGEPKAWCNSLSANPVNGIAGRTQFEFHIDGGLAFGATWTGYYMKYSKDGGAWIDGMNSPLNPNGSGGAYGNGARWRTTFDQPGEYQVQGFLNSTAGNNKTADACKKNITVEPQRPSYDIAKSVDKEKVEPGGTLQYTLTLQNTGNIPLTEINIKDTLPKGMTLNGDVVIDPATDSTGDLFGEEGLTIARVAAGATLTLTYNVTVSEREDLECGPNKLTNTVTSTSKEVAEETDLTNNEASVDVNRECNCSDEEIADNNPDCVTHKTAVNNTQNGADATRTTANAGDVITYTLHIVNTSRETITMDINDFINDILEYADLTDAGGGVFNQENKLLSWPGVTLRAGERTQRSFVVTVKNPIPSMARGASQILSYDCVMSNSINSDINTGMHVDVNCPPVKTVEQIVSQLPATGAGTNLIVGGVIAAIVVFFYARSRQLGKEVRLVRKEFSAGTV